MEFFDTLSFGEPRKTQEGFFVVEARSARTGIQLYSGLEVGLDKDIARIYRPEEEVFKDSAMATFAHRTITDDHPSEMVNSSNWKNFAVGKTGGEIARDGQYIVVPLAIMDQKVIDAVESGKRELSAGYTCDLDMTPGKTPDGEMYDGIQRNIRINHLAIVDKGRAGSKCRIGDDKSGEKTMTTKQVTVDGITIEVTDQGAQVIEKLQRQLADASAKLESSTADHQKVIADKDKELATKDGEIDKLKSEAITADKLDELATTRADIIDAAKKIADIDPKGKTNTEIVRAAVASKLGDDAVKDKSDDYVQARFDGLLETSGKTVSDPVRDALKGHKAPDPKDSVSAYDSMCGDLESSYTLEKKEA